MISNRYSGIVLRTALAMVLLWFGFNQIKNPAMWTRLVPEMISNSFNPTTFIYINGTFEIIFATLLLLWLFTRTVSFMLTLHLLSITYAVGYGPVGARDFALSIACFSIFLRGPDEFCLDEIIFNKEEENQDKEELIKQL